LARPSGRLLVPPDSASLDMLAEHAISCAQLFEEFGDTLGFNKYFLPGYIALGAVTYILYIRSIRVLTQDDKDLLRNDVPAPLQPVLNRLLGRSE